LAAIRAGTFLPDRSRSGYIKPGGGNQASEPQDLYVSTEPAETNSPGDQVIDDSSSDSASQSSSDEDESLDEEALAVRQAPTVKQARSGSTRAGQTFLVHKVLGTLHLSHESDEAKLACGRTVCMDRYDTHEQLPVFPRPKCQQCFGSN
jgi:hypothetical protein